MNSEVWSERNRYYFIFLSTILFIFLANLNQIFMDCIIQNDLNYFNYDNIDLNKLLFQGFYRVLPCSKILNNFIFSYIFPCSAKLARISIILLGMIPVSLLFFYIYHHCFKMSYLPALFASTLPHVIPGQDLIPIFVNGSYETYALIPSLTFFVLSFFYVNENKGWPLLVLSLISLVVSFFSTELSLLLCIPIFSSLFLISGNRIKFYKLSFYSFIFISLRLVLYFLQPRNIANDVRPSVQYFSRFFKWMDSFSLINSKLDTFSYLFIYMLVGVSILLILYLSTKKRMSPTHERQGSETKWLPVMVFSLLWLILAGMPYVLLSSHPFSSRYGYPAAFGLFLLLVAVPYFLMGGRALSRNVLNVLFFLIIVGSSLGKLQATRITYGPIEKLTEELVADLSKREYPRNSQIVVAGQGLETLRTASVWPWSTGFLKYNLKRADLTGLVGLPMSFYDPFKKWTNNWNNRMAGLSLDKPTFIYGYDIGNKELVPKKYVLQWSPEIGGPGWRVFSLDQESGKISLYSSGVGMEQYSTEVMQMERMGINKNDIFGGQNFPKSKLRETL